MSNKRAHSRPIYLTTCRPRFRGAGLRRLYDIGMLSAETCPTYPPITVALLGTIAWIPPDCINFERQRFYEVTEHFDDGTGWRVCYGGVRKTLSKRVGYDDDGMDGRTSMIDPGLDSLSPLGLRLGFLSSLTCAFLLGLVFFFQVLRLLIILLGWAGTIPRMKKKDGKRNWELFLESKRDLLSRPLGRRMDDMLGWLDEFAPAALSSYDDDTVMMGSSFFFFFFVSHLSLLSLLRSVSRFCLASVLAACVWRRGGKSVGPRVLRYSSSSLHMVLPFCPASPTPALGFWILSVRISLFFRHLRCPILLPKRERTTRDHSRHQISGTGD
ncbi:hypothetical protein IWZ03DRAFT_33456 [Phyllosticta citriasiana]|uniref:Uncharacterized protein n=1 Tax=Phyllosticta citriasiana TaxID=595635 RepID=A0ABR1L2L7_9PEZI